jgi:hypothetical protein
MKGNSEERDKYLQQLADGVLAAWQRAHGTTAGHAHGLVGPRGVAIILDDVLSRGELRMAEEPAGQDLLVRYVKGLLNQVCAQHGARVQSLMGREIHASNVSVDGATGRVLLFYEFASKETAHNPAAGA